MDVAFPAIASLLAVVGMFTLVWWASLARADVGIIDLFWGPGFVLVGLVEAAVAFPPTPAGAALLGLTALWAARLTAHLWLRHRAAEAEDARYAAMRREGGPDWPRQSLWRIFWVQALALWAIATPLHVGLLASPDEPPLNLGAGLALILFFAGFAIEALADAQLARFKADPARRGQILTDGLFALVRHPNYLGEILVWWGLGLLAFSVTALPLALAGPALLTFFIVKVSGVPPLEAVLASRPGYARWVEQTPALWPRFRRDKASGATPRAEKSEP